jgi:hypothetical protein
MGHSKAGALKHEKSSLFFRKMQEINLQKNRISNADDRLFADGHPNNEFWTGTKYKI